MNSITSQFKQFAKEDAESIINSIKSKFGASVHISRINVHSFKDDSNDDCASVSVVFVLNGRNKKLRWKYFPDTSGIIHTDIDIDDLVKDLSSQFVFSSTNSPIFGAEGDEEGEDDESAFDDDFMSFDDSSNVEDDDSLSDDLDQMSDQLEELQDNIEDIRQDDPSIDINNNIDNHYIAECDSCHGIFISAVIQSDQDVDKISGVCPLCERETDQYLKWVVKAVDQDEQQERTF